MTHLRAALIACLTLIPATARAVCVGDCDGDAVVRVDELITNVKIALGALPLSVCPAADCETGPFPPIACVITGVDNALGHCPNDISDCGFDCSPDPANTVCPEACAELLGIQYAGHEHVCLTQICDRNAEQGHRCLTWLITEHPTSCPRVD